MPALTPVPNIGSQIERAIIAWLWASFGGAKDVGTFYFSNDWQKRSAPLIDVLAHKSSEAVVHSRVEAYSVKIESEWRGNAQPGVTNPDSNWKSINDDIGVVMAAMSQTDDNGDTYRLAARLIAQYGRRLAVFGCADPTKGDVNGIANNADMKDFYCDYLEFKGSQRAQQNADGMFIVEIRNFLLKACNLVDDSIFPTLTLAAPSTLNWTFTGTTPAFWVVEKSVDGLTWLVHTNVTGNLLTVDISATGTQYWRVRQSVDGVNGLDPESNIVKATAV